ncbi:ABC transporter ATP-binding protein [Marinilabiliaceae bacterium ANBcel2]|nr:ABC transporter ATP-binding protein [Marinilabiliaceae bacterium ANBcel2]
MDKLIYTDNLAIGYGNGGKNSSVLHRDINVRLMAGEFACLLGPNGSGKSTLIKTFAGFLSRISGSLFIDGKSVDKLSGKEISKLLSVVLTERVMVPNMTVYDLVSLGRSPFTGFFGRLSLTDKDIIATSLESVKLNGFEKRNVFELSDGERQKAFIAKALVQETPLIVLDEPTAFLDLPSRVEIMHLLKDLAHKYNKGVLLSTHDLDLALQTADKIWLLAAGLPVETGVPEDLVLTNEFRKFFEREGVLFDTESGQFTKADNHVKSIRLVGKGVEYKWVSRALARNGFSTSDDPFSRLQVEISSDNKREYILSGADGKPVKLRTIEDLLERLKYADI